MVSFSLPCSVALHTTRGGALLINRKEWAKCMFQEWNVLYVGLMRVKIEFR